MIISIIIGTTSNFWLKFSPDKAGHEHAVAMVSPRDVFYVSLSIFKLAELLALWRVPGTSTALNGKCRASETQCIFGCNQTIGITMKLQMMTEHMRVYVRVFACVSNNSVVAKTISELSNDQMTINGMWVIVSIPLFWCTWALVHRINSHILMEYLAKTMNRIAVSRSDWSNYVSMHRSTDRKLPRFHFYSFPIHSSQF